MTQVRLYGPVVGNGSFCRVTEGLRSALQQLGLLAGLVPIDAFDEEGRYGGATAPLGFFIGPMGQAGIMQGRGMHRERLVLVPPNSTVVPASLLRFLEERGPGGPRATTLVSPSTWGATILRGLTSLPVEVAPHGVRSDFKRPSFNSEEEGEGALDREYADGDFNVLHLASTVAERKGTRELLRAWIRAARANQLGPRPQLHLTLEGPRDTYDALVREEADGNEPERWLGERGRRTITWLRRLNQSESWIASWMRRYHLVACPSRGEGFGLVSLESRACGIPALVTGQCTGHAEHCPPAAEAESWGVVNVPVGDLAPIDEAPGALAPSLDAEDVRKALVRAYEVWPRLAAAARDRSAEVRKHWNWTTVTEAWWNARSQ